MAKTGMGGASYLHLRLFMEGFEVPVIGASVTASVGAPASASIQLVPSNRLTTLLPRTMVHLFFLDSKQFAEQGTAAPDDHDYKLLFCGEVFDISYGKSGQGSRSVTLRCMDLSNVWDTNYSYIMRYAPGAQEDAAGGVLKDISGFVGGGGSNDSLNNANPFDDIVNDPASVIRQMSLARAGNPALPGGDNLLGGLLAILELLSGVQGLYLGVNPWATIEERRCRVMDSIASDNGKTAQNLFDQQTMADWIQQRAGTYGAVISFRQIIGLICEYIYYDVVTNVTPMYESGDDGSGRPGRAKPDYDIPTITDDETDTTPAQTEAAQAESKDTSTTQAQQFSSLQNPGTSKVNGLDAEFWGNCQIFLEQLDLLLKDKTYSHGALGEEGKNNKTGYGWPIDFVITSGYRDKATQSELSEDRGGSGSSSSPHVKGFALDFGCLLPIRYVNVQPFYTTGKTNDVGRLFEITSLKTKDIKPHAVLRKALYEFNRRDGSAPTTFDALIQKLALPENQDIRSVSTDHLSGYTVEEIGAVWQNAMEFFEYVRQAVKAANEAGANLFWRGEAKQSDPLFRMFGLGNDPIHVEDKDWRTKTATPITDSNYTPPDIRVIFKEGESRERLKSFIFRPNIWFCPPPTCNVVYPDMYESLSVNRQMLRETTRLQLDAFNQFYESVLLSSYYYAPKFPEGNHVFGEGLGSVTKTVLMDHEVFSGIIPKMERISEITFYAKQSGTGSELRKTTEETNWTSSEVQTSDAGSTIQEYGDRVAHFNLLTHRYSARSGGFQGPFNPYLVCGFPAVIINELYSQGDSEASSVLEGNRPKEARDRVHWLGMITSLTHTYDQGGARTSAQLQYLRSHRVGDDTDDLLSESVTSQGNFSVQDPNFAPAGLPGKAVHSFVGTTVEMGAEDAANRTVFRNDWIFKAISVGAIGKGGTLADALLDAPVYRTAEEYVQNVLGPAVRSGDNDSAVFESTFSFGTEEGAAQTEDGTYRLIGNVNGPNGGKITAIEWSGAPYWIVVRFVRDVAPLTTDSTPTAQDKKFIGDGGNLVSIQLMSLDDGRCLIPSKQLVQDNKALGVFPHFATYSQPDAGLGPTFEAGSDPYVDYFDVAIQIPGSEIRCEMEAADTDSVSSGTLPVEEAIRPPWIDKDTYSAQKLDGTNLNIDKIYQELFGCNSILNALDGQSAAKPYGQFTVFSVEQAVDYLVATISSLKTSSAANSYIEGLQFRPIATLMDVLAPKGTYPSTKTGTRRWVQSPEVLTDERDLQVSGGFHSNAVCGSKYSRDGSTNLNSANLQFGARLEFLDIVGLDLGSRLLPTSTATIDSSSAIRADPRAPRASRVSLYLDDINGAAALRQPIVSGDPSAAAEENVDPKDKAVATFVRTPSGQGKVG